MVKNRLTFFQLICICHGCVPVCGPSIMGTHLKWLQPLAPAATPVDCLPCQYCLYREPAAAVLETRHWCSLLVLGRPDMIDLNASCFGYTRVTCSRSILLTSGHPAVSWWLSVAWSFYSPEPIKENWVRNCVNSKDECALGLLHLKRPHTSNSVTPQRSLAGLCYCSQAFVGFTPSLECTWQSM